MILVAGGSGRLGGIHRARVDASRGTRSGSSPEMSPGPTTWRAWRTWWSVTFAEPDSLAPAMLGVTVVVSGMHGLIGPRGISPRTVDDEGNSALIEVAGRAGADVVLMSVVGATADSPFELFRAKHSAEERLRAAGLPATVVRATAFMETWIEIDAWSRQPGPGGRECSAAATTPSTSSQWPTWATSCALRERCDHPWHDVRDRRSGGTAR